jgi:uncharacterized protein (TIGR02246 family)
MRTTLVALGVVAAGLLFVTDHSGGGQPAAGGGDEQAIRQAVAAYAEAFNKGDLTALAAFWAPDAEFIDESGAVTKGRDAIAALFKKAVTEGKGVKMALKVTRVRELAKDVVMQDGTSAVTAADGSVDQGRYTSIWVRADGKWQIHSARDLPSDSTDPGAAGGPLKDLAWSVGEWEAEKGGVSVTVRWVLNQAYLSQEYRVKEADGEMAVMQLVGYDPLGGQIKSWTFDSRGGFGEGLWARDGHSWVVETTGVLPGGQTGRGVNVIRYVDENTIVFQSRDREIGGQPIPNSEVKLVRKPAAR